MGGWEKVGGTEVGVGVRALEARCPLKDSRISVEGKISSYKNDNDVTTLRREILSLVFCFKQLLE